MKNGLINSLKETLLSPSSMDLVKEYAEISLDSALDEGTLKNIPILNTIVGLYKIGTSIKDRQNLKKISVFLEKLHDIPDRDRESFLQKLEESDKYRSTMFEKILVTLERLDEVAKAEIIGNLFKLYVMEAIDRERFQRFSSIVERAFLYDLMALHYSESTFYRLPPSETRYYLNSESETSLAAFGIMEQVLEEKPSEYLRARGINDGVQGLGLKISKLGKELASLMFYDLSNPESSEYIYSLIRNRTRNFS